MICFEFGGRFSFFNDFCFQSICTNFNNHYGAPRNYRIISLLSILLRCRDYQVIPKFLTIKHHISSYISQKLLRRASMTVLRENICDLDFLVIEVVVPHLKVSNARELWFFLMDFHVFKPLKHEFSNGRISENYMFSIFSIRESIYSVIFSQSDVRFLLPSSLESFSKFLFRLIEIQLLNVT